MANDTPRVCFDRVIPLELSSIALQRAVQENPENGPRSPLEAAVLRSRLWRPGRTLRVRFLDGLPEVQAKVQEYAQQWTKHANINFEFGDDPDAEIRISFQGKGSWSALGTDALVEEYYPMDQPTMNYGWLDSDSTEEDYSEVVLHEFGHALGMIHEHSSPASDIEWNREAVIDDLSGPPNFWDEATIEHNVFRRYSELQTQFTEFDPKSIMLYTFPEHWTLNDLSSTPNTELSEVDKAFMAERYPRKKEGWCRKLISILFGKG
jgi:hypothetical protein